MHEQRRGMVVIHVANRGEAIEPLPARDRDRLLGFWVLGSREFWAARFGEADARAQDRWCPRPRRYGNSPVCPGYPPRRPAATPKPAAGRCSPRLPPRGPRASSSVTLPPLTLGNQGSKSWQGSPVRGAPDPLRRSEDQWTHERRRLASLTQLRVTPDPDPALTPTAVAASRCGGRSSARPRAPSLPLRSCRSLQGHESWRS